MTVIDPLVTWGARDVGREFGVAPVIPVTPGPLAAYEHDPAGFITDCIRWPAGDRPTGYQLDVLARLTAEHRVSLRGPHTLGKTALMSWVVLWFALTRDGRDWKIPTTASAWYQLTHYLWPEIHKWSRRVDWDAVGRPPFNDRTELQTLSLKLETGEAFAIASSDAARIEGAHADHVLYVFDEAKTIPPDIFDAAEGALAGEGEALALMASTPGEPTGRFYDVQSRKAGTEDWAVRNVTKAEAIEAGRMRAEWAADRARQWGPASAVYLNRVEGEFASSEADTVIPLPWVEAAVERWRSLFPGYPVETDGRPRVDRFTPPGPLTTLGIDVARSGEDRTVMAPRYGDVIGPLRYSHNEPTDVTAGRASRLLEAQAEGRAKSVAAIVDVIGVGAGVVDQLRADGYRVVAFNASEGTKRHDRSGELGFLNCRAAAWWAMRDALDPANGSVIALPPDDSLVGDLTAPRWKVVGKGLIQVESKDDIRSRLGRSTDAADGVIQAFWSDGAPATVGSAADRTLPKIGPGRGGRIGGRAAMVRAR